MTNVIGTQVCSVFPLFPVLHSPLCWLHSQKCLSTGRSSGVLAVRSCRKRVHVSRPIHQESWDSVSLALVGSCDHLYAVPVARGGVWFCWPHRGHRLIPGVSVESVHPLQGLELGRKVRVCARRRRGLCPLQRVQQAINSGKCQPTEDLPKPKGEHKVWGSNSIPGGGIQRGLPEAVTFKLGFEG